MTEKLALDIQNLSVSYKTDTAVVKAVNDLTFQLKTGQTLGLVGETGAGKTTTALAIMGLLPEPVGSVDSGKIIQEEVDLLKLPEKEMRKLRGNQISMIFQDPMTSLNPVMKVGNQIAECFIKHQDLNKKEALIEAGKMLEMVGISAKRAGDYPHQFSGGMKQRVIIAIALACNPHLLIADEPTTALDVTIQAQVLDLMKRLRKDYKTSLLMITHDLGVVADICDEVAIMYAGRIVEKGNLEDIFDNFKHPYTEGLFNSLPDVENRHEPLRPIKGLMPDPTNLPAGCSFFPRCPYAKSECEKNLPSLSQLNDSHYVACLAYEDKYKNLFDFKLMADVKRGAEK